MLIEFEETLTDLIGFHRYFSAALSRKVHRISHNTVPEPDIEQAVLLLDILPQFFLLLQTFLRTGTNQQYRTVMISR